MTHRSMPAVAGLLLSLTALSATAQITGTPAKVGTREELRACLNTEAEVAERRKALEVRNQKNRDEAASIRAEAQQLAADHKKAEEDPKLRDRFNAQVKSHNARIESANKEQASFRIDMEKLNESIVTYNFRCGGAIFKDEDREAVRKEREAAKKN